MATITIPDNAIPIKKGMLTKEVYFDSGAKNEVSQSSEYAQITNNNRELYIDGDFAYDYWETMNYCFVRGNGKIISEIQIREEDGILYNYRFQENPDSKVKASFETPIKINYSPKNPNTIFCIPLREMVISKPEKLNEDATYEQISDVVKKINISIQDCKYKLSDILNSKGITTQQTDTISSLIEKVKQLEYNVVPEVVVDSLSDETGLLKYHVNNVNPNKNLKHLIIFNSQGAPSQVKDITNLVTKNENNNFSIETSQFADAKPFSPHTIYCFYEDSVAKSDFSHYGSVM